MIIIARQLNIPGCDDMKADIKKLVQLHLSKESAGQWLLIFDNAEEGRVESAGPSKTASLIDCLPSSKHGAIVFTTTDKETATKLVSQNIVELLELEQNVAQKMLDMHLDYPTNKREKADLLLKELAYLPLAIVQAAAYINVHKLTLQEYLSLVAKKKEEVIEPNRGEHENVIATTWIILFEQICRQDTLAADYLLFMACVDRNDIPLALLPVSSSRENDQAAIKVLEAYSFVTKRTAESALDLHRLVHVLARKWLKEKGMISQGTEGAIARLAELFPNHGHGNRSKWRRLLPHAMYALSVGHTEQKNEAMMNLMWKCAMSLYSDGRWKEAEELEVQVMEMRKRLFGEEHPKGKLL